MHCGDQRHAGLCLGRRPCTSRRRVQGRSQGTTLSASDLHNARATILNPFYNMEYKIIKKTKYDVNRSGHSRHKSHSQSVQCTRPSHCLRQQWRHNPIQLRDVTIATQRTLLRVRVNWGRNRFEIYGSALELISISLCTGANAWMFDSVYIKGNQMKLFQQNAAYFIAVYITK